ncbi:DUF4389 domain-containing protein [Amycolatopsis alkalitolerans]|uniref:DUF4389 domain-containing protein n=1 Tax=Amycolatopsis alkalitolerans TaxID=2547244 RepID=A0A5C4LSA0_9PSEU|nr:DUF4389 domain-containing protein [Amycolatopsis alkalitolerans]TNC19337.1 DUF4389 domain-containing protein [Amycolatopsis alkalitolerans]
MTTPAPYPVRVEASLDPALSRWLWLVKWLLAIPHYIVLAFLWFAFALLSVVAFFAILFTGRYPRAIFEFNVGVLRWTWRVQYYGYQALGTDQYPPFTLADVPEYPARLEVDYPQHLSRGLVLVKWWLLAIPHYIIAALFVGGGSWLVWQGSTRTGNFDWAAGGLVGVLVLIAAIVLLFTGKYPKPIFDFVLGMDRWVLRVAAYAGLMTDQYPPFRMDLGGHELTGPIPGGPEPHEPHAPGPGHHWTGGRIASVIVGAVLALTSMGLLTGGATLLWADKNGRDADGYLSASNTFTTPAYALTTEPVTLSGWTPPANLVGDVRIRATSADPAQAVFIGIAPTAAADRYLANVEYATVRDLSARTMTIHSGTQPAVLPQDAGIWAARTSGLGTQTLSVPMRAGDWTVVVMHPNGSPGLDVLAEAGATAPGLGWLATWVLVGGIVLLAGGVVLIAVPVHRASRQLQPQ